MDLLLILKTLLFFSIPGELGEFARLYQLARVRLGFKDTLLEVKWVEEEGIISWSTRGQLGIGSPLKAMTGYQATLPRTELVPLIKTKMEGEKSIVFVQFSLRSAKDVFKDGGHVTPLLTEKVFNLKFDNRRLITAPVSGQCSEPVNDIEPGQGQEQGSELGNDVGLVNDLELKNLELKNVFSTELGNKPELESGNDSELKNVFGADQSCNPLPTPAPTTTPTSTSTATTLYFISEPHKNLVDAIRNRKISSFGTRRYNVHYPSAVDATKNESYLKLTKRVLVRLLLQHPEYLGISPVSINRFFICEFLGKYGITCLLDFVSKQRDLPFIPNTLPQTKSIVAILDSIEKDYPKFTVYKQLLLRN